MSIFLSQTTLPLILISLPLLGSRSPLSFVSEFRPKLLHQQLIRKDLLSKYINNFVAISMSFQLSHANATPLSATRTIFLRILTNSFNVEKKIITNFDYPDFGSSKISSQVFTTVPNTSRIKNKPKRARIIFVPELAYARRINLKS